ncbi:MAG TPA: glycosyltransferase family 2 protein [Patescibacteria group bacterium]|nr:glycosyltransferase family 2 protein [Patescibacteria group bacterium]
MEQVKQKIFTISVIIPTYNSEKTLGKCLTAIRNQDYPQNKIEIILGDGGSTDNTKKIAKEFRAKVISVPTHKQNAEFNRGVAYNTARGELVLVVDHDNFLPNKKWLQEMIVPLNENPNMVATTTCYYHYNRSYGLLDRYFALFGTSEPLPYYLHKADRMPQTAKKWVLTGKAEDKGRYYLVHFEKDPRKIPSVGTNGCLMRRDIVNKFADIRPEYHYPIDVMVDVIQKGHNEFGFVKNSIIHLTGSRGILSFLRRRILFVEQYAIAEKSKRRWGVYMKGDNYELLKFVFYSITFIKPLWDSCRGFAQIADVAWFLQPIMCIGTTFFYGYIVFKAKFKL